MRDIQIIGTLGDDLIVGDAGNDTLNGVGGDDTLVGAGGNDNLIVGQGNSILKGGSGNDSFELASGNHTVEGGDDFDTLIIDNSNNRLGVPFLDATLTDTKITGLGVSSLLSIEAAVITGDGGNNILDAASFFWGDDLNRWSGARYSHWRIESR